MEVKIGELAKLLEVYIGKKKPLFIHGAPGIGKSDSVRQAVKKIAKLKNRVYNEGSTNKEGYNFLDVRASQLDPSDIRGIPFPEGQKTKWLIPVWLPSEGEGVLFLDELNLAPPSIQASFFQLILDRRVGDYRLPDGWTIVAAGNRAIDKANIFPLSAPLKNRFSHVTVMPPSEDEWIQWAAPNGINMDIIAFIKFKPAFLCPIIKDNKDDAFPTHRSIALASKMTEGIEDEELHHQLMASCVGDGFAHEFRGFTALKNKVNVEDIIRNPEKALELKEPSLKYTLISGLAQVYSKENTPKKRTDSLDKVLAVVGQEKFDPEFGIFLLRLMQQLKPDTFNKELVGSSQWKKMFSKYQKFLI